MCQFFFYKQMTWKLSALVLASCCVSTSMIRYRALVQKPLDFQVSDNGRRFYEWKVLNSFLWDFKYIIQKLVTSMLTFYNKIWISNRLFPPQCASGGSKETSSKHRGDLQRTAERQGSCLRQQIKTSWVEGKDWKSFFNYMHYFPSLRYYIWFVKSVIGSILYL